MPPGTMRRRRGRSPEAELTVRSVDTSRSYDTVPAGSSHRVSAGSVLLVTVCVFAVIAWRASTEWHNVYRSPTGAYVGAATLVGDPELRGSGVVVVFRIEGWRYEATLYGANAWRVRDHMQGETVRLSAVRERFSGSPSRYKLVRHVAGRLSRVTLGGDWTQGSALTRATNRLRRLIARGSSVLPVTDAALLLGLVIGDDRAQPREMRDAFRSAGLSHLTAVSGQNIAFVLAVFAPLLTRLRPRGRLVGTVAVLGAFTLMTRAEPSVLRAGAMAGLSAVVFAAGGRITARRTLFVSSTVLAFCDPFLLWSVGFWLSFAATLGLVTLTKPCERLLTRLRIPPMLVMPFSTSLAAQVGTLPVMIVSFGRVAPFGLLANLFAVPVAGAVMLAGLPMCAVAGLVGGPIASMVMSPVLLGVRYVWWVAVIVARIS